MSENKENQGNANVIQGPWPKAKRKVKLPEEDAIKVQEQLAFADDLTESLMVQLIHTMHENGFHVNDKSFVQSMGFVIEVVKASIYKEMSLSHPMVRIMNTLSQVTVAPDETMYSEVDIEKLGDIAEILKDDDESPEVS
jgi:hypothetical protein